jgi:formylglycine-generating enzyme required for sulfatase activity
MTPLAMSFAMAAMIGAADFPPQDTAALLRTFRQEFVDITPGRGKFPRSFVMGTPGSDGPDGPAHEVTFDYDFAIAAYEVPQNLWLAVMGSNPSRWHGKILPSGEWTGRRNSVEMLSYDEALEFCRRVTALLREAKLIEPHQVVRLPSEAEWEYAARAGTRTRYSFGDDPEALGDYGWYHGNAAGNDPPVGAKKPNPWGLYDIHGYLWEWCADAWHDDYRGAPADGSAWRDGGDAQRRVLRGGSWKDPAERLACAYRLAADRKTRGDHIGLRCVLATEK